MNASTLVRANSHRVPSPTHVSKSQHGGKVPTCEPQVITKIWLIMIKGRTWLFRAKIFAGLGLRVGSSFLLYPTCKTSPSLTSKKCCHVDIHLIVGTQDLGLVWSDKVPIFILSTVEIAQIDLKWLSMGLRTWDPWEVALTWRVQHIGCWNVIPFGCHIHFIVSFGQWL